MWPLTPGQRNLLIQKAELQPVSTIVAPSVICQRSCRANECSLPAMILVGATSTPRRPCLSWNPGTLIRHPQPRRRMTFASFNPCVCGLHSKLQHKGGCLVVPLSEISSFVRDNCIPLQPFAWLKVELRKARAAQLRGNQHAALFSASKKYTFQPLLVCHLSLLHFVETVFNVYKYSARVYGRLACSRSIYLILFLPSALKSEFMCRKGAPV